VGAGVVRGGSGGTTAGREVDPEPLHSQADLP